MRACGPARSSAPRSTLRPQGLSGGKVWRRYRPQGLSTPQSRSVSFASIFISFCLGPRSRLLRGPGQSKRQPPQPRARPSPQAPALPLPDLGPQSSALDPSARPHSQEEAHLLSSEERGGAAGPAAVRIRSRRGNREGADSPQPADSGSTGAAAPRLGSRRFKPMEAAAPTSLALPT